MVTIRSIMKKCTKTNKTFYLVCACLSVFYFAVMLRIGGKISLWADEIAQVGYINKGLSFGEILWVYLKTEVTNLPFFPLVAALWYRIAPWGEKSLYLITEIPVALGVFFLGLTGKEWRNERTGYFSAAFAAISFVLLKDVALNFRAYSFTFFFAVLMIYFYCRRFRHTGSETRRGIFELGIVMTLFAYSNYFSCILIVGFFVCDVILFLQKKIKLQCVISYVMSGVLLAPWFILMLIYKERTLAEFWPKPPTLISIPELLKYLVSDDEVIFAFLILSMVFVCVKAFLSWEKKEFSVKENGLSLIWLFGIWFTIIIVFIYSAKINPMGGIFVKRYFMTILPLIFLCMSFLLDSIVQGLLADESKRRVCTVTILGFLFCYFGLMNYYEAREVKAVPKNPYRECAQWLSEQDGIYEDSSLVLLWEPQYYFEGFREYYVAHYCDTSRMQMIGYADDQWKKVLDQYDRVYLICGSSEPDEEALKSFEGYSVSEKNQELNCVIYTKTELEE